MGSALTLINLLAIRDYDSNIYIRAVNDMALIGGFDKKGIALSQDIPSEFQFKLLGNNWDHFRKLRCCFTKNNLYRNKNMIICKNYNN